MTHNPETVERVAKAAAFSIRQPNDVSADADEYWQHTEESARHTWIVAITAALSDLPPQEVSVPTFYDAINFIRENTKNYHDDYGPLDWNYLEEWLGDEAKRRRDALSEDTQ